ncbi:hypothetical protein PanWU01x14_001430 [Parasponia andersonii]|uniref:RNase H type-1 domain-containing protein n=1 Tax=Parasponia andersonii TaxID=3476 RepID=A0A2P5E4V5_PARAD|nr:hypothetical protein PanWU01x14_001430 [Parasponia andersonii]
MGCAVLFTADSYPTRMGILQAELMAIKEGLSLVSSHNLSFESIETDSLQASLAINSRLTLGAEGILVSDIIAMLTLVGGAFCCHIYLEISKGRPILLLK